MKCPSPPCAEDDVGSSAPLSLALRPSWARPRSSPTESVAAVTGARTAGKTVGKTVGIDAESSLTGRAGFQQCSPARLRYDREHRAAVIAA